VVKCNGTTTVTIKTLHGKFPFALQRLSIEACEGSYFDFTGQCLEGYTSQRLKEFSAYYSNRLSYEEVESLIERQTGEKLLSDQKIWQIVVDKAVCVSEQLRQEVQSVLDAVQMPAINPRVDIYDPNQTEILLLEDAIQVKEQKQTREKRTSQDGARVTGSRVSTDVMMLEKADGGFHYLTAGIDAQGEPRVPLADIVRAKIAEEYGTTQAVLNIVAITDGAKAIRSRFVAIFGMAITLILDWYHLEKKVTGLMSMIAINKQEKELHVAFLCQHLWRGKVQEVVQYLRKQVRAKNGEKLQELIGYLEKHDNEIIDYERRKKAGKSIGSGRMEKGVDQVIGYRQKKKGMSWSQKGSKALAILKVVELNSQWEQIWFPERKAA
jgi:hypothetical protein